MAMKGHRILPHLSEEASGPGQNTRRCVDAVRLQMVFGRDKKCEPYTFLLRGCSSPDFVDRLS
jgi:hypothetical protein